MKAAFAWGSDTAMILEKQRISFKWFFSPQILYKNFIFLQIAELNLEALASREELKAASQETEKKGGPTKPPNVR